MRLRAIVPTLLFAAVVVTAVALGPLPSLAVGSEWAAPPSDDAGTVYVQVQDRMLDGTCVALDPDVARHHLRSEFCTLLCLEPQSADVEATEPVRILRRAPLAAREAAVDELLFDAALRDTEAMAEAIPDIAERHDLDEDALRDVVVTAREHLYEVMVEEGLMDEANAACLLERLHEVFEVEDAASGT